MAKKDEKNISKVDIEKEKDIQYRQLLRNEYVLCIPKFPKIIKNANSIICVFGIY